MFELRGKIEERKEVYADLQMQIDDLNEENHHLYPKTLSNDMVEELAKSKLNLKKKNEILIFNKARAQED